MEEAAPTRKVYPVAAFNRRLAGYLARVRDVWVEGELSELRRSDAWASVFLTLKDTESGACLPVTMARRGFDAVSPVLTEGERIQVMGRLQLYEARGELSFRVTTVERVGAKRNPHSLFLRICSITNSDVASAITITFRVLCPFAL
jgi:exonuclease VII large subunit